MNSAVRSVLADAKASAERRTSMVARLLDATDPLLLNRVAVVAVARAGDALSMGHYPGKGAEQAEDGYDIKLGHIEDALQKIGLRGIEAFAFDASADKPADLTGFILEKIRSIRKAQADTASRKAPLGALVLRGKVIAEIER
jgi:hypothetical protein